LQLTAYFSLLRSAVGSTVVMIQSRNT
jgi:hypothetical protein